MSRRKIAELAGVRGFTYEILAESYGERGRGG